jgi:1-acyl-sn-glycerol-3-phosphate acyltransferase
MDLQQILAVAFLWVVLLAIFGLWTWRMATSTFNFAQAAAYVVSLFLVRFQWRARVEGTLDIPDGQGAVIVCNHRSSLDPCFVQTSFHRKIHWMVAREYCESKALGWFLRICEVIPVGRGGVDTQATKLALRRVQNGEVVGMLPEGRINMSDDLLLPVRPGAALVALKCRVPIFPVYIQGAPYNRAPWSPLVMTANAVVRFGPMVDLSDLYGREGEEGVLQTAILRCAKAIAVLAGQPDYEPRLAGRTWKPTAEEIAVAHARR